MKTNLTPLEWLQSLEKLYTCAKCKKKDKSVHNGLCEDCKI